MKYEIPKELNIFLKDSAQEKVIIGCSNTEVIRITKDGKEYFLKIGSKELLYNEYQKLKYLQGKLPVPKIVMNLEKDGIIYLLTTKVPGEMVCSDYYMEHQSEGIDIIVKAFNLLYKVDINDCPFDVSLDYKLSLAESNITKGLIKDENIDNEILTKFGSQENILKYLKENKFKEELCFSHGDISLPNIFANNNNISGFIDVGECGIADKWFDIAIVIKSIIRNYGEEYVAEFLEKLNVEYDEFKYNYYMILMQLYL